MTDLLYPVFSAVEAKLLLRPPAQGYRPFSFSTALGELIDGIVGDCRVAPLHSLAFFATPQTRRARFRSVTSPTSAIASMNMRVGLNCVLAPSSEAE